DHRIEHVVGFQAFFAKAIPFQLGNNGAEPSNDLLPYSLRGGRLITAVRQTPPAQRRSWVDFADTAGTVPCAVDSSLTKPRFQNTPAQGRIGDPVGGHTQGSQAEPLTDEQVRVAQRHGAAPGNGGGRLPGE